MNSERRFILAIALMIAIIAAGNLFFAPPPAEVEIAGGDVAAETAGTSAPGGIFALAEEPAQDATAPGDSGAVAEAGVATEPGIAVPTAPPVVAEEIVVQHSHARFTLSTQGARITSVELPTFNSGYRDGAVELVEEGSSLLGMRIAVGRDTLDLRNRIFTPSETGVISVEGETSHSITFRHDYSSAIAFEVEYTFQPGSYLVEVRNRVYGVPSGVLITDLGKGIPFNEVDERAELRNAAYVVNHLQEGVRSTPLEKAPAGVIQDGPFLWAAVKSQYFVAAVFPGLQSGESVYLGGLSVEARPGTPPRAELALLQSLGISGEVGYRFFAGPQDYGILSSVGSDFEGVSPIGWRWLRPVVRPIVGVIMWVLVFLHDFLGVGYGWVLVLFGVLMRILLFPLNHKAMKAQLRNMAVQPLLKEIQTKYKDQPEKMQKELMRLYKEYGFNPLAGCWPLLLPWPILIALFFAFQHAIELRGTAFWWLPDLAAKDPFFILPVLLGVSMFLMQWITIRSMDDVRPEMKFMMWGMPIMMTVLFAGFPSGLNLYYLSTNIATLPQSWWIAEERKKAQAKGVSPMPKKPTKQ